MLVRSNWVSSNKQENIPSDAVIEIHPMLIGARKGLEICGATLRRCNIARFTKAKVNKDPKLVTFATADMFPSGRKDRATMRTMNDATKGTWVLLLTLPNSVGSEPSLAMP